MAIITTGTTTMPFPVIMATAVIILIIILQDFILPITTHFTIHSIPVITLHIGEILIDGILVLA